MGGGGGGLGGLPQGVLCHVEKIALVVNIFSLTLHQYEIFSFCRVIYGDSQQLFLGTIFLLPKLQNFTLCLQRSFKMAEKLAFWPSFLVFCQFTFQWLILKVN